MKALLMYILLFSLANKIYSPKHQIVHKSPHKCSPEMFQLIVMHSQEKNGKVTGNRTLTNHPPQMLVQNFSKRVTRGKKKEVDQVIKRLENLHLYSDELDGEPKGELVSFALVAIADLEPSYFEDACINDVCMNSMEKEMHTIEKNDTWELVELPKGKKDIGYKRVYKTNFNIDGTIERHKARLVVKGFT